MCPILPPFLLHLPPGIFLLQNNFHMISSMMSKKKSIFEHIDEMKQILTGFAENIMDQIRLVSTYKGIPVPSMIFDSTGTKKIAAIASYV